MKNKGENDEEEEDEKDEKSRKPCYMIYPPLGETKKNNLSGLC